MRRPTTPATPGRWESSQNFGLRDDRDGTSNTLLAGEVNATTGAPAAWGDPDNLRDPGAPLNSPAGFGGNTPGQALLRTVDGAVHEVSTDIDPAVLRAPGAPNGGEPVGGF